MSLEIPEELLKLHPERHPMLPWRSLQEMLPTLQTPAGRAAYADWVNKHRRRVMTAEDDEKGDPYRFGWELEHWVAADAQLARSSRGQCVFGGKRATKSERAAKRVVQAAYTLPRTRIWCMQGSLKTSRAEQQSLVWKYLPPEIKAMNGKARHGWAKVNYSQDMGFASEVIVLPNRSEIHFLTYNQDPKDYQGWKLGAVLTREELQSMAENPWLHNVGAWMDEDLSLPWFNTIELRCASNAAKWIWTFSPLEGVTQAIKEAIGVAKTTRSRRAELLPPGRKYVPDCPEGHMPVEQESSRTGIGVSYFHTEFNPFGANYEQVKVRLEGKPEAVIKQDAYGYAEDLKAKAFPKFSSWNVIEHSELPAHGTNYLFTDPAGARMWFTIWVRVVAGNPTRFYVYRDHPDCQRFGPWAVPSPDPTQMDGVAGPAQRSLGWGWIQWKNAWRSEERITVPMSLRGLKPEQLTAGFLDKETDHEIDPFRRRILREAVLSGADPENVFEPVYANYIDPRAGRDGREANDGSTTPIDELAREHRDAKTGLMVAPSRIFLQAPGLLKETGITAVNELLNWDMTEPYCKVINEPCLYVSRRCEQVITMMNTFTDTGGEKSGWKDPFDLLRYIATAGLTHVSGERIKTRGGGSY